MRSRLARAFNFVTNTARNTIRTVVDTVRAITLTKMLDVAIITGAVVVVIYRSGQAAGGAVFGARKTIAYVVKSPDHPVTHPTTLPIIIVVFIANIVANGLTQTRLLWRGLTCQ